MRLCQKGRSEALINYEKIVFDIQTPTVLLKSMVNSLGFGLLFSMQNIYISIIYNLYYGGERDENDYKIRSYA